MCLTYELKVSLMSQIDTTSLPVFLDSLDLDQNSLDLLYVKEFR